MTASVACLHHLDRPLLGHAGAALAEAGLRIDERDLAAGDALPRLEDVAGIVSFGGDQSVTEIERWPYLVGEAELLREAVGRGVPVLGICLGAQLLAHALGAAVRPIGRQMLTWAEVEPLAAAVGDPVFGALEDRVRALHWNEDCFDLPGGAVELLTRAGPGVEAFRAGARAWGVQFHPEVDAEDLEHWYAEEAQHLAARGISVADARAADARHLPGQTALARTLFGGFARVVADTAHRPA